MYIRPTQSLLKLYVCNTIDVVRIVTFLQSIIMWMNKVRQLRIHYFHREFHQCADTEFYVCVVLKHFFRILPVRSELPQTRLQELLGSGYTKMVQILLRKLCAE
jgi:hypothetical protein